MEQDTAEPNIPQTLPLALRIGNTPLLRLEQVGREQLAPDVCLFAKAEWHNPGGSVKDRPALRMILDGLKSGRLTKDKVLVDATSGNTGISYAMIGAALSLPVKLFVPSTASSERKSILESYGAQVIYTDPVEGIDGARLLAAQEAAQYLDERFYPDQYNNPSNWRAHYESTALEIFDQTGGRITHFVAGLGTTGTFVGTSRRLKELNPGIRCISFQPDSPMHGLEGLKHLASATVPGIYDPTLADGDLGVSTEEAYAMVRRLDSEEGLKVGPSSGAALAATLKVAKGLASGLVVMVFPDDATKYLSQPFWGRT